MISEKTDLFAYASKQMQFKKQGENYYAHCPCHEDKTPSLCFTPSENFFYCYSCGVHGNIIDYLRVFEHLPFADAVEKAASLANVDLSQVKVSPTTVFLKQFRQTEQKRKISQQNSHKILPLSSIEKYPRGEVPEWQQEGISRAALDEFGVRLDNSSSRIVYPVYDTFGNLINVKGRTRIPNYKELKIPKYINYYPVGTMDYFQSLEKTKPYIAEKHEAILVESVKSVMKLWTWGIKNSISAETHTLTNSQLLLLLSLRCDVVLAFDKDVDYFSSELYSTISKLKRITNVYIIEDKFNLLGDKSSKNAPVDCGEEIWNKLYQSRRKLS